MSPRSTIVSHGRQRLCETAFEVVSGLVSCKGILVLEDNLKGRLDGNPIRHYHGSVMDSTEEY
jgi:hypothetical protein